MPGMKPRVGKALPQNIAGHCPVRRKARRRRLLRRVALGVVGAGWMLLVEPVAPSGSAIIRDASDRTTKPETRTDAKPSLPAVVALELRSDLDELTASRFADDVRARLPRFQGLFQQAALRSGMDWRLLAAVGYQESKWNPVAVSPTGVRGIMMLALDTADEMDVDREDPAECIAGGAQYFQQIRDRLPPQIREPDRTNMALVAYNQGLGHLQDARTLAAQLGGDPNRWKDVRRALPLMAEERWFAKARHGYFDGQDALDYVYSVRGYYTLLHSVPETPVQVASVVQ